MAGLSQRALADRTGFKVRYISRLENISPNITLVVLERLAKGLGCSPSELLGDKDGPEIKETAEILDQTIESLAKIRKRL